MLVGELGIVPRVYYRFNQPVYNPPPETTEISSTKLLLTINQKRNDKGLDPFKENLTLSYIAYLRAKAIVDTQEFTHVATISGLTDTRIADKLGYFYQNLRENLAIDYKTEDQIVKAWERSEKHAENIFTGEALDAGIYSLSGDFFGKNKVVTVLILGRNRYQRGPESEVCY